MIHQTDTFLASIAELSIFLAAVFHEIPTKREVFCSFLVFFLQNLPFANRKGYFSQEHNCLFKALKKKSSVKENHPRKKKKSQVPIKFRFSRLIVFSWNFAGNLLKVETSQRLKPYSETAPFF